MALQPRSRQLIKRRSPECSSSRRSSWVSGPGASFLNYSWPQALVDSLSRLLLGAGPLFPVRGSLPMTHDLLWVLPLALVLGAVGPAYQKLLYFSGAAKRLPFALLWGGLGVGL